ncbi:myoD family inhibitor domain-containing protein 2 [Synchiropus splendidus]|uniref:myoD family inhibitor domain-containing protein 2 n=1 Tax=Synchiropus splendidus TaxID=270530 RepID=UPI00237EA38C|nr:myoD family inhibitor domain-containing protein 2 [Synchiropus splendidus]
MDPLKRKRETALDALRSQENVGVSGVRKMADEMILEVEEGKTSSMEERPGRERRDRMQNKSQASSCRRDATTEAESGEADQEQERECDNSTAPLFSLKMYLRKSSSTTSADSLTSQQSSSAVDCAEFVLKCLFCRFYDIIQMFPDSCKRAVTHCCPCNMHVIATVDSLSSTDDDSFVDLGGHRP